MRRASQRLRNGIDYLIHERTNYTIAPARRTMRSAAKQRKTLVIKHIVMWKLKNADDAPRFAALLESCAHVVPGIVRFEVARCSAALEANMDVLLNAEFADVAALNAYQEHPHHKAVSKELGPLRETRCVLDYEA
jgi:quinol monooxygenase YgiN